MTRAPLMWAVLFTLEKQTNNPETVRQSGLTNHSEITRITARLALKQMLLARRWRSERRGGGDS